MKCACPWCNEEAEPHCEAMFSGEPTCKDHDWRTFIEDMKRLMKSINSTEKNQE